jgi:hypothetical protein
MSKVVFILAFGAFGAVAQVKNQRNVAEPAG